MGSAQIAAQSPAAAMQEIPLHQIDNFLMMLKWAHQKGFSEAEPHIMQPLQMFYGRKDTETHADLYANLDKQRKLKEWRIVANIYKHIFHTLCFDADHHALFKMLNAFLYDLQAESSLRKTTFAYEFFRAFEYPMKTLQSKISQQVAAAADTVFESHNDLDIVVSHSLTTNQRETLNREAHELFTRIELAYARGDESQLSYLLAQFTGRFCNYPEVKYRDAVDDIISKITENNAEFKREMRSRLAVRLYQSISRSLEKMDLRTAVRGITTYVITFQDDLALPYREDLDHLEEKMYRFIKQHNLWHRVRLQHPANPHAAQ